VRLDSDQNSLASATVIMNPYKNGHFAQTDANYVAALQRCHNRGVTVIGYVYTAFGSRAEAAVKTDVDAYFKLYPKVSGIFFDEMSNTSTTSTYYAKLYAHVKAKAAVRPPDLPTPLVVGNPGATATTDWQLRTPVVDILVNLENSHNYYVAWSPPSWVWTYPAAKFAHLVHGSPSTTATTSTCAASVAKRAGMIYVTRRASTDPWNGFDSTVLSCTTLYRRQVLAPL
jgi:hypothetical protein